MRDDSFCQLKTALENEDYETAFRASHTLKGVFVEFKPDVPGQVISELTEVLRPGEANEQIGPLFDQAEMAYQTADSGDRRPAGKERTIMKSRDKVLIVDDSDINRSLLADMLAQDYELVEASTDWKRSRF